MIIPWKVDVPPDYRPAVNWLIIAGIILMFILQLMPTAEEKHSMQQRRERYIKNLNNHKTNNQAQEEEPLPKVGIEKLILDRFELKGLLGHMWLHGGIFHLLGNLLFLWIFGNAVCSKLGNLFYLPIYLALGIWAGIAHLIFQGGAVIGASGAIMGIVGMYLVFFPRNNITCFWFWALEINVASYWIILYWIAFDIFGAYMGGGSTAYFAHLGGFATGIGLAILMLKLKWVQMNPRYEESLLDVFSKKEKQPESTPYNSDFAWLKEHDAEVKKGNLINDTTADIDRLYEPTITEPLTPAITEPLMPLANLQEQPKPTIRFQCSCGKRIKIAQKYAGKSGKCPKCKTKITVPSQ